MFGGRAKGKNQKKTFIGLLKNSIDNSYIIGCLKIETANSEKKRAPIKGRVQV